MKGLNLKTNRMNLTLIENQFFYFSWIMHNTLFFFFIILFFLNIILKFSSVLKSYREYQNITIFFVFFLLIIKCQQRFCNLQLNLFKINQLHHAIAKYKTLIHSFIQFNPELWGHQKKN